MADIDVLPPTGIGVRYQKIVTLSDDVMPLRRAHLSLAGASASLLGLKVHAAAEPGETASKKIKISQLPLYESPDCRVEYVQEEAGKLQQQISRVRKVVWRWMESLQSTTDVIKEKYEIGKAHTESTIDYIQNEPGMLPRVGVISLAAVTGALLGFRGGVIKKVLYGSIGGVTAAALCYPNETVDITKQGYEEITNKVKQQWNKGSKDRS